jgi:hypothetical protein
MRSFPDRHPLPDPVRAIVRKRGGASEGPPLSVGRTERGDRAVVVAGDDVV